ncbi:MAG: type II secretion system F family protein [Alcaligenaceae bacterium]
MNTLALVSACLSIAMGSWLGQRLFYRASQHYRKSLAEQARSELSDLFVFIDLTHLWPALVCLSAGVSVLLWLVTQSVLLAVCVAGVSFVLPRVVLTRALRKRQQRFDTQLPDFLLALSGALRAGAGLSVALKHIVQEASPPMSQEFGLVLREQRMGVGFVQALMNLYQRMPSESTELVTTMLIVGARSGASLADLLERLCTNLRDRQHLEQKIEVMTTQGKMQAWIMGALPVVLLVVLSQVDPVSVHLLHSSSVGQAVLLALVTLECLGVYVLRRILAIHV